MEGSQYNYSSYHSGGGGGRENDFQKLSQTIGSNIQKISQNVSSIQRMVTQLGTPQDTPDLRSQLHQIQHYTGQLAKDTSRHLKELSSLPIAALTVSEQRQWKLQRDRLTNEFSTALNTFQTTQRRAAAKEKEEVKRARAASGLDESFVFGTPKPVEKLIDLGSPVGQTQSQTQIAMQEEADLQALEAREQAIRQLESDIVDVNQIFKDLATLVHEQGEVVDSIEAHVESAQIHVSQGTQELGKASNYQAKARKKMCILFMIGLVVLAIFIGIIAWQLS